MLFVLVFPMFVRAIAFVVTAAGAAAATAFAATADGFLATTAFGILDQTRAKYDGKKIELTNKKL